MVIYVYLKMILGNSLVVQWLGLGAFTIESWVQSLVRELISGKPCGTDKKKKILQAVGALSTFRRHGFLQFIF